MFLRFLRKILTAFFISAFLIIFVVGYFRSRRQQIGLDVQPLPSSPGAGSTTPSPTATPGPAARPTPVPTSAVRASFTGTTYRIPWGDVTVSIDVESGKVIGIHTPDIPDSPPSQYAQPILIEQALQAGSANIQGVSGATYTSLAFERSLENALVKANIR